MEAPISLNVMTLTTPHRDLDHLPLADRDFQIKDLTFDETPLKLYCKYWDNYLNHADKIGLWESNLPKYQFPTVHIFPDIIHQCHANYDPNMRVVMTRDQTYVNLWHKGRENVDDFLKPTIQQPKSMADYLKTNFEVLAKDIHPIGQIELHK